MREAREHDGSQAASNLRALHGRVMQAVSHWWGSGVVKVTLGQKLIADLETSVGAVTYTMANRWMY